MLSSIYPKAFMDSSIKATLPVCQLKKTNKQINKHTLKYCQKIICEWTLALPENKHLIYLFQTFHVFFLLVLNCIAH